MKKSYLIGGGILIAVILVGFWLHSLFGDTPINQGTAVISTTNVSANEVATNLNGVGIKDSDSATNVIKKEEVLKLTSGVNYAGMLNNTGQTLYVTGAKVVLLPDANGTKSASSTMIIDIATSTTEHIADYSNPFASIIDSASLATSTATSTINSIKNAGTNGTEFVPVANGQYVSLVMNNYVEQIAGAGKANSASVEHATSTNRGFDLWAIIDYELYKDF